MLEWNVYRSDWNKGTIVEWNVFDHGRFFEDCIKNRKKNAVRGRENKDAFIERLRRDLMYYYWSKCEWEIVLSHWPGNDRYKDEKIDVYDQIWLNWDRFVEYVWEHRMEFKKEKTT